MVYEKKEKKSGKGQSTRNNLIDLLTSPVRWFQTIEKMIMDGATEFLEIGPGNVLSGLNRRINREIKCSKATL